MLDSVGEQLKPHKGIDDVNDLVIADLAARKQQGIKKYGTPLQTYNGRNSLIDCYQELLDAALYIRQSIKEIDDLKEIIYQLYTINHNNVSLRQNLNLNEIQKYIVICICADIEKNKLSLLSNTQL